MIKYLIYGLIFEFLALVCTFSIATLYGVSNPIISNIILVLLGFTMGLLINLIVADNVKRKLALTNKVTLFFTWIIASVIFAIIARRVDLFLGSLFFVEPILLPVTYTYIRNRGRKGKYDSEKYRKKEEERKRKEAEERPVEVKEEVEIEEEYLACDRCGGKVDEKDTKCPTCGAIFEEEVEEKKKTKKDRKQNKQEKKKDKKNKKKSDNKKVYSFICSNCGTKVKESSTKCPKCGETFEEETIEENTNIDQKFSDLNKLKKLLDDKIITKEEFEKEKKKILK